ncbi:hypothetical protein HAX54_018120 [Datura stramonium]|uniref:Uncharacterized protein n=1 Tax=Datura stramonium TaxID=4076 RepID=A0ABS8UNZ0_DATST|nr:hypothetical protein [Datura stramonium]
MGNEHFLEECEDLIWDLKLLFLVEVGVEFWPCETIVALPMPTHGTWAASHAPLRQDSAASRLPMRWDKAAARLPSRGVDGHLTRPVVPRKEVPRAACSSWEGRASLVVVCHFLFSHVLT